MDPLPLVVCGTAATLYALGRRGRLRLWREVSFYSGVALAFVVLEPPFDTWADTWLSAHMTQHAVLMTIVPPLVVLGPTVAPHVAAVSTARAACRRTARCRARPPSAAAPAS